jgi:hypothetical protein
VNQRKLSTEEIARLPVIRYCQALPPRLLKATGLSSLLAESGIEIDPERLIELADAHLIPHYRVDGGAPLFYATECRKWIAQNLTGRVEGASLPLRYSIVGGLPGIDPWECPACISQISDRLFQMPATLFFSGVYFLCLGNEVVYVGQAFNVASRISAHHPTKNFDRVYALSIPKPDLDFVEAAFIRLLRPKLNTMGIGDPVDGDHTLLESIAGKKTSVPSCAIGRPSKEPGSDTND